MNAGGRNPWVCNSIKRLRHARPDLYFFTCLPSHLGMATFSMEVSDNEVVPSTLSSIAPILCVAAEIEPERPRVAYLCKLPFLSSAFSALLHGYCQSTQHSAKLYCLLLA